MIQNLTFDITMLEKLGLIPSAAAMIEDAHLKIKPVIERFEALAFYHQAKVLNAFTSLQISQRHMMATTGYGYGDDGRDALDKLFAKVFDCEDALVRPQWVSGTHVLSDSLFALLRPGETLLSVTGRPYDTLHDVIGINNPCCGSLAEWGVMYRELDLKKGEVDIEKCKALLNEDKSIRLVLIQRSRGYGWRPSLSVDTIGYVIRALKSVNENIQVLVDNCYGEFTEQTEPCAQGANLMVGSLIKNPGGGLAPTGAYAAGTCEAIEKLSYRLTSPGIGREVGAYPGGYRDFYQGLFIAPHIVSQALMTATLAGCIFEGLGYDILPAWDAQRSDIIQSVRFRTADELIAFCQGIQAASPVDGHAVPYPWDMPGYTHQVIMAAGTFVQGASIELSADAPIKDPYIAYVQGGLTYAHGKIALMHVLTRLSKEGHIHI